MTTRPSVQHNTASPVAAQLRTATDITTSDKQDTTEQQQQEQQQQEKEGVNEVSSSDANANRRLAAQSLPHWLSHKGRVWRNRTMQYLNLPPSTAATTAKDGGESSSSSSLPLPLFQDEESSPPSSQEEPRVAGKDLYSDSIGSFYERIQQHCISGDDGDDTTSTTTNTTTISTDLQHALDRLVAAGFANVQFARRFAKMEEYQARDANFRATMSAIQSGDLDSWQAQRSKWMQQLDKEQRKYNQLQQQLQQQEQENILDPAAAVTKAEPSSSPDTVPKEEAFTLSPLQSILTAWKRFVSPTTTETTPSSSTDSMMDDKAKERKIALHYKLKHNMELRIKSYERSIANCDSHIQSAMQRLDKLAKQQRALEQSAPLTLAEYKLANQVVVESVMNVVCQELARHIDELHSHTLEEYRVLDAKYVCCC
jgi:hypothetical protein